MPETEYIGCFECLGTDVDNTLLLFPCLRFAEEGYKFENDCPKKARGVKITKESRWHEIDVDAFKIYWNLNKSIGTIVNLYGEDEDKLTLDNR